MQSKRTFSLERLSLGREADLAVQQLCSGLTALGKADHTNVGLYTQAFFGLSIGIERTAKLILIADYAIDNEGSLPKDEMLKKIGHGLSALLLKCEVISAKHRTGKEYWERPRDDIHKNVVVTLDTFARASRYYNLDFITGQSRAEDQDPIKQWWLTVAEPILNRHLPTAERRRIRQIGEQLGTALEGSVSILHHQEDGTPITDFFSYFIRGQETPTVQKFSRLYVLQIIRWLSYLIHDLSEYGGYNLRIEPIFGIYERYRIFMNSDSVFKNKGRWP